MAGDHGPGSLKPPPVYSTSTSTSSGHSDDSDKKMPAKKKKSDDKELFEFGYKLERRTPARLKSDDGNALPDGSGTGTMRGGLGNMVLPSNHSPSNKEDPSSRGRDGRYYQEDYYSHSRSHYDTTSRDRYGNDYDYDRGYDYQDRSRAPRDYYDRPGSSADRYRYEYQDRHYDSTGTGRYYQDRQYDSYEPRYQDRHRQSSSSRYNDDYRYDHDRGYDNHIRRTGTRDDYDDYDYGDTRSSSYLPGLYTSNNTTRKEKTMIPKSSHRDYAYGDDDSMQDFSKESRFSVRAALKDDFKYSEPQPLPRPDDVVYIEVFPGVSEPLRRTQETKEAVDNDFITSTVCFACDSDLFCIADVKYYICPTCKCVSLLEEEDARGFLRLTDAKTNEQSGVGLGFTYETLFKMQSQLGRR